MEEIDYTLLCTIGRELDEMAYSYCSLICTEKWSENSSLS